jgi:predicted lipid-binding transport protein (Tim44 family)
MTETPNAEPETPAAAAPAPKAKPVPFWKKLLGKS